MRDAAWLSAAIVNFAKNVGSVLPKGFDDYARIFHPLREGPTRRWAELAALNGRIAHPEMQYHLISSRRATLPSLEDATSVGSLPRDEFAALTAALSVHTSTDEPCYFAVWEGFGQLHGGGAWSQVTSHGRVVHLPGLVPDDVLVGPRLVLPNRRYLVAVGALTDGLEMLDHLDGQSPNLWWPASRSWCVATEIDFGWTYVGGPTRLIDDLVRRDDLEVMRTVPNHGVTFDSDLLNASPDG